MSDESKEIEGIFATIKNSQGSVIAASMIQYTIALKLLVYLFRLVKKAIISLKSCNKFKDFLEKTEGRYKIYNIPLSKSSISAIKQIQEKEVELEKTKNPFQKRALQKEIDGLRDSVPELKQLDKRGIDYCMLPKINGADQMIQVAVSDEHNELFKGWYQAHLQENMIPGEKNMGDLSVFTENNYSMVDFEFERLKTDSNGRPQYYKTDNNGEPLRNENGSLVMVGPYENIDLDANMMELRTDEFNNLTSDLDNLGIRYAVVRDLNVNDGHTQIVVANADLPKFDDWVKLYRMQQAKMSQDTGKSPKDVTVLNKDAYTNTGRTTEKDIMENADPTIKEQVNEFNDPDKAINVNVIDGIKSEKDSDFAFYNKDIDNYYMVSIDKGSLVEQNALDGKDWVKAQKENGNFVCIIPGTEQKEYLIVPKEQVFHSNWDENNNPKTYYAFIPKNTTASGSAQIWSSGDDAPRNITASDTRIKANYSEKADITRKERVLAAAKNNERKASAPTKNLKQEAKTPKLK